MCNCSRSPNRCLPDDRRQPRPSAMERHEPPPFQPIPPVGELESPLLRPALERLSREVLKATLQVRVAILFSNPPVAADARLDLGQYTRGALHVVVRWRALHVVIQWRALHIVAGWRRAHLNAREWV